VPFNAAWNDKSDLSAAEEFGFLERRMRSVDMEHREKTHEANWWNGREKPGPSLTFKTPCRRRKFRHIHVPGKCKKISVFLGASYLLVLRVSPISDRTRQSDIDENGANNHNDNSHDWFLLC